MVPMEDSGTPAAAPPNGLRLGRVWGIPVYLSASWLILAVLITLMYGGVVQQNLPALTPVAAYAVGFGFVVCLVVSVFLHELGHAVVSRRAGIRVRGISLEMLGGFTEMEREAPTPRVELAVALVGPAVSAVLGLASLAALTVLHAGTVAHELIFQLTVSNLIVAVFNVLPGLPLDGGRALRALVWAATSDRYLGTRVSGYAGRAVAVLTMLACVAAYLRGYVGAISIIFGATVAVFLWLGAGQAVRGGRLGARFRYAHAGRLARPALQVPSGLPLAEAVRQTAQTGAGAVVVVDSAGTPVGLVHEHAAAAVPAERQPWVSVDSVSRTLRPGLVLPAELAREDLMRAVQAAPATEYLVVDGALDGPPGRPSGPAHIVGVLVADDLANLLDPKRTIR